MANINRDWLVILEVKRSIISTTNTIFFKSSDRRTCNIFIQMVINNSDNILINKYANIENCESYTLSMNILKPNGEHLTVGAKLHSKEDSIYEVDLPPEAIDIIGAYSFELVTKCEEGDVTVSNQLNYIVQKSIFRKDV